MSPLILIGMFSLVSASAISTSEVTGMVDDIIAHANELVRSNDLRNMSLPELVNGNWFVKRHFTSGSVQDLATIRRIGNPNMTTRSQGTMSQYSVEATIGLECFEVEYHYRFLFLWIFETSGRMRIRFDRNAALTKTVIVTDTIGNACALLSKDIDVQLLEDVDVTIEEGGFLRSIVARSVKYSLRSFLPNMIKFINWKLDEFNQDYPISPKMTQYVCKYFM